MLHYVVWLDEMCDTFRRTFQLLDITLLLLVFFNTDGV
jgi:hypothetical protein